MLNDPPSVDVLGSDAVDALDAVGALCARSLRDPPSLDELRGALCAPDQPRVLRGDPDRGVVATVESGGHGHVRLLVVDPSFRGRGIGGALLAAAEADLTPSGSVTVGADAPYYLWPGADVRETALLCLLERRKYQRVDTNFNMTVDLTALSPAPPGPRLASEDDRAAVDAFTAANYPNWTAEVRRALGKGTLVVETDEDGVRAVCAWDVNRRGLLGPVAVRLGLIGRGAGAGVLLGALHAIASEGRPNIDVSWVGPIVPYARVGGRVSRVFIVYRKALPA